MFLNLNLAKETRKLYFSYALTVLCLLVLPDMCYVPGVCRQYIRFGITMLFFS